MSEVGRKEGNKRRLRGKEEGSLGGRKEKMKGGKNIRGDVMKEIGRKRVVEEM